jgi:hypothetical protein
MPITINVQQVGTAPNRLSSPLAHDVLIAIKWAFNNLGARTIEQQECKLQLDAAHGLHVLVSNDDRAFTFRLSAGTHLTNPLTAEVRTRLSHDPANPPDHAHGTVLIEFPSSVVPERETMTAIYGELNQELRRMRTLYESFLVVVTGGFATLVSKASSIVGYPHRGWMGWGVFVLALIVIYLLWQVAPRYRKITHWTANLETALGLRSGTIPPVLLSEEGSWWRKGDWRHTLWAVGLTVYTFFLGLFAVLVLYGNPLNKFSAQTAEPKTQISTPGTVVRQTPAQPTKAP